MKKIIISVLIVLLGVLAYFTIFEGISLGNLKIFGVEQIMESNRSLEDNLLNTNGLLKIEFPTKEEELSTEIQNLLKKKEEYFNLAKISTEGEISKANTEEIYLIEYLWTRIGRHATSKGVNLKMDVKNGDAGNDEIKNLAFTMNGSYVGIIDFIYAIEDDSELNFKIENFKMTPSTEDENLTATFNVKNIRIKKEKTTVKATTQTTSEEDNTNDVVTNDTAQQPEVVNQVQE